MPKKTSLAGLDRCLNQGGWYRQRQIYAERLVAQLGLDFPSTDLFTRPQLVAIAEAARKVLS